MHTLSILLRFSAPSFLSFFVCMFFVSVDALPFLVSLSPLGATMRFATLSSLSWRLLPSSSCRPFMALFFILFYF